MRLKTGPIMSGILNVGGREGAAWAEGTRDEVARIGDPDALGLHDFRYRVLFSK